MKIEVDTDAFPDGGSAFLAHLMRGIADMVEAHGRETANEGLALGRPVEIADGRRMVALADELRWATEKGWEVPT